MKILHINNFRNPDYLNDMIFHGGRTTFGLDYVESTRADYMYKSYTFKKNRLYGKGFTVYCKLDDAIVDNTNLREKIISRYFDFIIYGSVNRCLDYFDVVRDVYPKNKVIFLDGEDSTAVREDLLGKGIYFKRENIRNDVLPIGFSIPKECIVPDTFSLLKYKKIATVIPGDMSTYIFDKEEDYYRDYQQSLFAHTCKKAGWDCLRHYEIIANYCIPIFPDLKDCPEQTMTFYPKEIILEHNKLYKNNYSMDWEPFAYTLWQFAIGQCTTESMLKYILNQT